MAERITWAGLVTGMSVLNCTSMAPSNYCKRDNLLLKGCRDLSQMNTREEAIVYLKSLGFYACERILSGERVVFVAAESVSSLGMMTFRRAVVISRFNYLWTIL